MEACRRAEVIRYRRWSSKVGLKYDVAPHNFGKWEELTWMRDKSMLESVSDASFAPTRGRSVGAAQMFWAGSLVSRCGGRQPFAAASTAEAELLSLTEAFMSARAMEALIAALHKFGEYTDNTATLQLCQFKSASWRTRHIRLRATIVREALESDDWRAAHLPGLFTPADVANKAVGPQRLADLMRVMDLYTPHMEACDDPPRPSMAAVSTPSVATKVLIALLLLLAPARAESDHLSPVWTLELSYLSIQWLLEWVSYVSVIGRATDSEATMVTSFLSVG